MPEALREISDAAFSEDPGERRAQRLGEFRKALRRALKDLETSLGEEAWKLPEEKVPKRWVARLVACRR